jgi:formate dehydrogenase iron-sulfur subunit
MTKHALLIDLTQCVGCHFCEAACQSNKGLSADTQLVTLRFNEFEGEEFFSQEMGRKQCMHCLKPACASACTVGALQKTADGPVIYDAAKCIGCRYCMYACPFQVPTFQWNRSLALINKCDMCADRLAAGEQPACAAACPTGAIKFGERSELLEEAYQHILKAPDQYVHHVYGEHEAGGTSVLYLSGVPFAELGFLEVGDESPAHANEEVMHATPTVAAGMMLALSGIYWTIKRRNELMHRHPVEFEHEEEVSHVAED